jgi:hypothetical protein
MAIVQISQIKHRRGVNENLPQLASAELGWSIDTRQLYIGNGTLEEGAPEVGNTEILTEYSAIPGVPTTESVTLADNSSGIVTTYYNQNPGFVLNYVIQRQNNYRTGYLRVSQFNANISYDEEYNETSDIGVTFTVTGNAIVGNATVYYTTTSTGYNANLKFTSSTYNF